MKGSVKTLSTRLLLVALFLMVSAQIQAETEPNNIYSQANLLAPNGSNSGNLAGADSVDWWKVTINVDGRLVISTVSDIAMDVDLFLFDQNGTSQIAKYDTGLGPNEAVHFDNLLAGTYYVKAINYSGSGNYSIGSSFKPAAFTGDIMNNDLVSGAVAIAPGGSSSGHIGFFGNNYTDTTDWWKITTTVPGALVVKTVSDTNTNIDLEMYDSDQATLIAESDSIFGVHESATYNSLQPGTYYIKLYRRYSGFSGYTITAQFTASTNTNDAENNDLATTALDLPVNGSKSGNLRYYGNLKQDTVDWYKITIPNDGYLQVKTLANATLDVDLFLYDQDGLTEIADYDTGVGPNESVHYNNLKAGTYFIQAFGYSGYGGYTISSVFEAAALPNDTENNDSAKFASELTPNQSTGGHIGFFGNAVKDTIDWWKVTLTAAGSLIVRTVSDTNTNIDLIMYDSDQTTEIAEFDTIWGVNEAVSYRSLIAGTYYIKLYRRYSGFSAYSINAEFVASTHANDVENNDLVSTALVLPVNGSKQGNLGYYGSLRKDTVDWYKITIPDDGYLRVSTVADSTIDVDLFLHDQDGLTEIARYDTGLGIYEAVHYNNLKAGTYFIQAKRYSGYGGYVITSEFVEAASPNDTENNDIPQNASTLLPNVANSGHIGFFGAGVRDTVDWWRVVLPEAGNLRITTVTDTNTNIDLILYGADTTNRLAGSDSIFGIYESSSEDGLAAGTYLVKVYRRYQGFSAYSINTQFIAANVPGDAENNDSVEVAIVLPLNDAVGGNMGYASNATRDSVDWYKVTLPEDGSFLVRTLSDTTMDVDLFLMDQDGVTQIARFDTGVGKNESVHYDNLMAGTYYIRADDFDGYGGYLISSEYSAALYANDSPGNDTSLNAEDLLMDSLYTGHLGYFGAGKEDENDWWKFELSEETTIQLRVKATDTTDILDVDVFLSDDLNNRYLHSGFAGDSELVVETLPAGIYYIDVYKFNKYGSYTISLTRNIEGPGGGDTNQLPQSEHTFAYPNPSPDGMVHITNKNYQIQRLRVMDAIGNQIYFQEVWANKADVNLAGAGPGFYIVEVFTDGGVETRRVIVR